MPREEVGESWTIRTFDGDLIEISSIAELKSRIISREFNEEDEIRRGNEAWKTLGDIPELAPHFGASRSRESRPRAYPPALDGAESAASPDEPARMSETAKKTLLGIGLAPIDEPSSDADDDEPTTTEAPPQYHRTIQMQPGAVPPPAESEDLALRSTLPSGAHESAFAKTVPAIDAPPARTEQARDAALPVPPTSAQSDGWFETPSMVPPEPQEPANVRAGGPDARAQLHFNEEDEIFPGRQRRRRGFGLGVWLALLLGLGFGLGIGFRDSLPEPLRENVNAAFRSLRGLFAADAPAGEEEHDEALKNEPGGELPSIAAGELEESQKASPQASQEENRRDKGTEERDEGTEEEDADQLAPNLAPKEKGAGGADASPPKKPETSSQTPARATPAAQPALTYDALVRRADSALERGRTAAARKDYEQALELRPGASEALTGLGYIALDTGSANQAATHFRRAAANGYADAYIGLGGAYRRLGRHADALAAYERYLERWPNGNQASVARAQMSALRAMLANGD